MQCKADANSYTTYSVGLSRTFCWTKSLMWKNCWLLACILCILCTTNRKIVLCVF